MLNIEFTQKRYLLLLCVFFMLCSPPTCIYAQSPVTATDTIKQKDKSLQYYLKQQSENSLVYKKLYEWLVVSKDSNIFKSDLLSEFDKENAKYNHKVISSIKIKQVSPFAKSILDTLGITTNRLEERLSKLRFETKESIIKNNLTFKNGEFVKGQNLKDSERLLRSLNFITDALIVVEPASTDTSLVNVLVITQDSYPYGGLLSLSGTYPRLGFYSRNVLGFGLEMGHELNTRPTKNRSFGIYEYLRWQNIYGSYFTLKAEVKDQHDVHFYTIGAQKDFFIPEIKYAGGFNIHRNYAMDTNPISFPAGYHNNYDYLIQDYWAGKSIMTNAENFFNRSSLTFNAQALFSKYYALSDSMRQLPRYLPNQSLFGSVSFSKRDFYKNQLIYNYGRTEDVPYGFIGALSFGFNHNEIKNRLFAGAHFSSGKALIPNKGYLFLSGDLQSFFYRKKPEDSRLKLKAQYISSLKKVGLHRWRAFLSADYVKGYHNSYPNYLYISESRQGIKAFNSKALWGTEKMVVSAESILFSSRELLGFKMAFFGFYDMGWISNGKSVFRNKPFYSLGGGFRIRNDNLVINTIQIQLAYFPRVPPQGTLFDFRMSTEQVNSFKQLAPRKPYVDVYK
ncbi:hypothetical protein SAMN06265379_10788 [Saccharicrinis carchari]|uniref:Outer membrane protein assembly factor BamA n=1 Tax=Saccharicrinis carchari TaxID=1168039 RepID=A0A521E036_SACCC|nr:hypothetical protein [Saccharicrinis carchari]SMO77327.1 hypothetical protein SAMN06265379_10788 [Saccharicrinis carchari]